MSGRVTPVPSAWVRSFTSVSRNGAGDAAMLYTWPVLWAAYVYGRKATALIVVVVCGAHAAAFSSYSPGLDYVDRWIDVAFGATVVAVVVQLLVHHADQPVSRLELSEARFRDLADRTPDIVFQSSHVPEPHLTA